MTSPQFTPNATMIKFEYPRTLIRDYQDWLVLLRPAQVTIGALVLAYKGNATALSEIPAASFNELAQVFKDIETALRSAYAYDKINYLLLMMVDNFVHFHILPRYKDTRMVLGMNFFDAAWPGPPDITSDLELSNEQFQQVYNTLISVWPKGEVL